MRTHENSNIQNWLQNHSEIEIATTKAMQLDYTKTVESPEVLLCYPKTSQEVSEIVKICHQENIGITTIGGATNLNQGTVPEIGNIAISLQKMNAILEINTFNRYVIVEAGCTTANLIKTVEKEQMYFPQNIASGVHATIGGNIAVTSGSPRSLYHGQTKDYILNLEVVLADGTIIETGKNVSKNASGYNLTQYFVGSEGTLGIITKATFKLKPLPKYRHIIQLTFTDFDTLFGVFETIFRKGYDPVSMEFLDAPGIRIVEEYFNKVQKIDKEYLLWLEWESNILETLTSITDNFVKDFKDMCQLKVVKDPNEFQEITFFRSKIGYAVQQKSSFKDIDVVVPRSEIKELYMFIKETCESQQVRFTAFAHIGNGNLHLNILQQDIEDELWKKKTTYISDVIFQKAIALGGSISGEHGIGYTLKEAFHKTTPQRNMAIINNIKKIFDPTRILNAKNLIIPNE